MTRTDGQRRHDDRSGIIPKYVDRTRSGDNSIIIKPETAAKLKHTCENRRSERETKRSMKNNAAASTVGIITFGTEAQKVINKLSVDEQDRIFSNVSNAIAERLNNNVSGLVVHRDESAIHAHFQMPAINKDGMPNSKIITKQVARDLQDVAGKELESYQITRGKARIQRIKDGEDPAKWVNQSVKELHDNLPVEIEKLQLTINEQQQKQEKNERLIEEQQHKLSENKVTLEKAESRIKTYEKRAEDAKAELEKANNEIVRLKEIINKIRPETKLKLVEDEVVTSKKFFGLIKETEVKKSLDVDEVRQYVRILEANAAKNIRLYINKYNYLNYENEKLKKQLNRLENNEKEMYNVLHKYIQITEKIPELAKLHDRLQETIDPDASKKRKDQRQKEQRAELSQQQQEPKDELTAQQKLNLIADKQDHKSEQNQTDRSDTDTLRL